MLKQKVAGSVQEVILPDFPDDDTTFTTTVTKSRRVSFGPNFVKEFIADSAVTAQCMSEYEQPFPSSDSSGADSSHSVHSTFVVHDSAKVQAEVNESRFKQTKFASTICFSSDSPTADMEFTEGCITLAKSILDKKNKEMSVFIQAKSKEPKEPKEEEKGKEEETNYFDGSQFEMSMTGCLRSKESRREERRLVSEKTRIFGRFDDEMSMTRCERFVNDEESDHNMEETKDSRMLLDAIMRHLDKDSSDSDLFNPERSLKRSGVNPFEMSDDLDLNESMEISGEVNKAAVAVGNKINNSNHRNSNLENLMNGTNVFEESEMRMEEVEVQSKVPESEPVVSCCEKSAEAMEISFDIQQNAAEVSPPTEDENPTGGLEKLETPRDTEKDSFCTVSPPKLGSVLVENTEDSEHNFQQLSSPVLPATNENENSSAEISKSAQSSFQQNLSSEFHLPEAMESENTAAGLQLEDITTELQSSEEGIQQDFLSKTPPMEEVAEGVSEGLPKTPENVSVASELLKSPLPCEAEAADVNVASLSGAEHQPEEPTADPPIEDMDITEGCHVPSEGTANREGSNDVLEKEVAVETAKKHPTGEAKEPEKAIPTEEDDSFKEPLLGDLKVVENLKEQSKEPGCVWSLQDLQHPSKKSAGLLSFSCRLFESTTTLRFTLKMSDDDSFDICSIVTDSSIHLDKCKEWRLPEYSLVEGFGFEELKKHFEVHRPRVEKIRHVPYFLDQINSFLSKVNAYLSQMYSVLTLYPGSRLRGSRLSFRLFSFPIFFSCVVTVDLSNMFRLSKASLSFEHDFGDLDEKIVGDIFEEALKKENSLCEFILQTTKYLVDMERKSGCLSRRGHIRLLPEELKQ